MTGTKKSGKKRAVKGDGRKASPGVRSAKPEKRTRPTAGKGLQREKDRWRELVDTSAAWIWETDADIRHTYTNKFVTRCLGYQPEEFLGLNALELVHPDDLGLVKEIVQRAVTGKEGWYDQVLRWRHKDGSWRTIESSGTALFDAQGAFTGLCGVDRDITEQKRAAEELRRSEHKYRDLFENAVDAIFITDSHQNYVDVNRSAVELFGYSREELLSMNVRDMLPPGQIARSEEAFAKLIESGAYEKFTGKVRRKDGTFIDVEVSSSAIVEQGQVVGSRDIVRNITDRRQAEESLRGSEERMRAIVESIPVGMHMYHLEPDGRLVFIGANPAADMMLGVDNDIFIGKTIEEAFPLLKGTEVPQRYRDAARSGKSWRIESIDYQADAIKGVFEVHAFQTAPFTMVAAFENITARKLSELALKQGEERYRRLYNETPVLLHSIDRQGRVVEVNDHWLRTLGYERSEVVGRKVTDFYTAASAKYAREVIQPAFFRDGLVRDVSYQFVKKNGEVVDVLLSATGERDAAGNVVRSQAVIEDITEHKKAEEALRASEERFRVLSEAAFEAVAITEKGVFLDANRQMCDMIGYSLDELKGKPVADIIAPEDRELVRHNQSIGYELPYENRLLRKDGSLVLVESRARHFTLHNRKVRVTVLQDITERKQAEGALRKSEKMLKTIIDAEPECVKVLDENACLLMMNRAGLDMLQVDSLEEVKGKCVCPLVTSEYRPAFMDLTRRVFQGGTGTLLFEMVGVKGRHLWLETHAVPLRNEKDEITAVLGLTRDVTERKRAEEELREKEAKYRTLFEAANDGIFIYDSTGIRDSNQRGAEMYGLPKEKVLGRSPAELAPERQPDGRLSTDVVTEKVQAAMSGASRAFEWQSLRADGTPFDVEVTLSRLELGGEPVLQAMVRDIGERKRSEEALRRSEARFRAIIEHASTGILVADVDTGKFRYANSQICSMLGYDAEEILTLDVSSIHPPADLPHVMRAFAARQGAQTRCLRKDGTVFPVDIRAVALELDGRQSLVGFFSDISEKQLLEEERIKTQKLESLGTLAGGIAHDFNNLLQGVFGYISMAKLTHDQKEKSLAMLAQAEKALHQSVNLTSQLLTFSKGGKPQKKVIDLRPVIENAVKFALSGSSTTAELDFSGDLRSADADEGQISQVVHNLVLNADQAMPEGGAVRISVGNAPASGLPRSLAAGSYVMITIVDSGVGIPRQYLEKIFDPYFTTKEKGSGLGLATSYSIVKNHGGALEVVSEIGKGTVFTIYLPASEQAADAAEGPSPSACARTCRVLLMDDEEMVRKVAYELLTGLDHEVELAEHGEEAVEKYRRAKVAGRPFDVVILDLTIRGGMGGAEAMQLLREIDPGVKAIVSSGYSDDDVVANYREHGFSGFLKKPYDLTGLQAALNELLA